MTNDTSKPEHIVLVAFCVHADDFADAQRRLMRTLPRPGSGGLDSWWIAEDKRIDGSDNDSAVFVPMGRAGLAERTLSRLGVIE